MADLMSKKWWFFILSLLIILPGLISLKLYGLRLSIDFTGGTIMQYQFGQNISQNQLQKTLQKSNLAVLNITSSGPNTYTIKTKSIDNQKISQVQADLNKEFKDVTPLEIENVGPIIGSETTTKALEALLVASAVIVLYLAIAFSKIPKPASAWRFGITAVAALLHDVLVVVGIFSILGHFLGVEIDVLFVTALLTIIGFSVHDTIVVFDRIRENLPKHLSKNFSQIANISILQTLARSLSTSLTVVFVLLALLLFGGETIKWFIVALLIGIISGTYSSIFNATALLVLWEEKLGH